MSSKGHVGHSAAHYLTPAGCKLRGRAMGIAERGASDKTNLTGQLTTYD